jgi:hypothetical protein
VVLNVVDQLKCIFQPRLLDNNLAQVHALFRTDSQYTKCLLFLASQIPHHHNGSRIDLFVMNIVLIERTGKDMYH